METFGKAEASSISCGQAIMLVCRWMHFSSAVYTIIVVQVAILIKSGQAIV